ncbi:ADP-ribosylglycohydrolase family protein [Streptomyces libani]
MRWAERTAGAVIGSAVGDALGAPFEFGPAGAFSARFPVPGAAEEMCGGGGWDPGEATDTVAAVTGGLAGAYYGLEAIPARWTAPLHVPLPGFGDRVLKLPQLLALTHRLAA